MAKTVYIQIYAVGIERTNQKKVEDWLIKRQQSK
jgi:hypothetical protein